MQKDTYNKLLYPLQDKVLAIIAELDVDFYLTGGTALSRGYFNHRYSDDLDFFVNQSPHFFKQFEKIVAALKSFEIQVGTQSESFARCFVTKDAVSLKLDFVNDVAFRRDKPVNTLLFSRTDTVLNILSNKISALSRNEPKDIADILEIAKTTNFNWISIISDAKEKDLSVDELDTARFISEFDVERLSSVL